MRLFLIYTIYLLILPLNQNTGLLSCRLEELGGEERPDNVLFYLATPPFIWCDTSAFEKVEAEYQKFTYHC